MMETQPKVLSTRILEMLRAGGPQTSAQIFATLSESDPQLRYGQLVLAMRQMVDSGHLQLTLLTYSVVEDN